METTTVLSQATEIVNNISNPQPRHVRRQDNRAVAQAEAQAAHRARGGRQWAGHKIGFDISTAKTTKEALHLAGLDFEAFKDGDKKVINPYTGQPMSQQGYIYRSDTHADIGRAGERFTVIQHELAFSLLDIMKGDGSIKFDNAWNLENGAQAMMGGEFDGTLLIAGEPIAKNWILRNNHDGKGSLTFYILNLRLFCMNQLNFAKKISDHIVRIRHLPSHEERIKAIRTILKVSNDYYKYVEETGNAMAGEKFSEKQFDELLEKLLQKPEEDSSKRAATLYESARDSIYNEYNADDLNDIRSTKWGAYNAVAAYADHGRHLRGANAAANEFIRTFTKTDLKDNAFALLTK